MFGHAEHWNVANAQNNPSLFKLAFGIGTEYRKPGFTAIFVLQMLAMCASIMVFLCAFNIVLNETAVGIFAIISSVFSLVVMILAFCSRRFCFSSFQRECKAVQRQVSRPQYLKYGAIMR